MPVHVVAEHLAIAGPSAVIAQLDTARATVRGWSEDLRQELQDLKVNLPGLVVVIAHADSIEGTKRTARRVGATPYGSSSGVESPI
jgi:cysteine synthase